jgi:hypothetical protein
LVAAVGSRSSGTLETVAEEEAVAEVAEVVEVVEVAEVAEVAEAEAVAEVAEVKEVVSSTEGLVGVVRVCAKDFLMLLRRTRVWVVEMCTLLFVSFESTFACCCSFGWVAGSFMAAASVALEPITVAFAPCWSFIFVAASTASTVLIAASIRH